MNVTDIRQKFLSFFERHQHLIVPSSSLVPAQDPTLLFTNAGMVPFKDFFLGATLTGPLAASRRATSAQRCVRAGGKHNDLENVGYTARHHTFFEMLGNFSFGDYFKREAIRYAWQFLTEVLALPIERLWVTVYEEDEEAYALWASDIQVPKERIVRIGDKAGERYVSDNFWQMANVGPCGPCTEIFYDHGPEVAGGPPGSEDADGDRFIEIWNIVFMQFNRDESGQLSPLPRPCVDTGMGLERIAAVLQGVHSNYDIDLFQHLIRAATRQLGLAAHPTGPVLNSLQVIADHLRACAFLVTDGVLPSNEGRGYVLRRILRRAVRHGYKWGQTTPFLYQLVDALVSEMGTAYPELTDAQERVKSVLRQEEERFFSTLSQGITLLNTALASLSKTSPVLSGDIAFKLHDTYGFPLDLTADICREQNIQVDEQGFANAMAMQRQKARAASHFAASAIQGVAQEYRGAPTQFEGYSTLQYEGARILALYAQGEPVDQLEPGQVGSVILDYTPFYAESGGQIGDMGSLSTQQVCFQVQQTRAITPQATAHEGIVEQGILTIGMPIHAQVNAQQRLAIARHHSATHLLHWALREILGTHVQQKGSLVDAQKLRFDFAHTAPLTAEEIQRVEALVHAEILRNTAIQTRLMSHEAALREGAIALFGERYETVGSDAVRMLDIGHSRELCGGTHVERTGDIGLFKITSQSGVAAGIRRIEAVAGELALEQLYQQAQILNTAAATLKAQPDTLLERLTQLQTQQKNLETELAQCKTKWATLQGDALARQAVSIDLSTNEIKTPLSLVVTQVDDADASTLQALLDHLKNRLDHAIIVLASVPAPNTITLLAGVTPKASKQFSAGELMSFIAPQIGGKGGGRRDRAQGGGSQIEKLETALGSVQGWIRNKVGSENGSTVS